MFRIPLFTVSQCFEVRPSNIKVINFFEQKQYVND